jgi:hypothetical protein
MAFAKYREGVKFGLSDDEADRFTQTLRRLQQAREAAHVAAEAEDYQAVGMRCREALLTLVRECADIGHVADENRPKAADFLAWIELVASESLPGPRVERLRSYVKAAARGTWELVQWVTHARSATRFDGQIGLDATINIALVVIRVMNRWLSGESWGCPACGSYQLGARKRNNDPEEWKYEMYCLACGWGDWYGANEPEAEAP